MNINEVGTNYEIFFPYSTELVRAVKKIPDSWWCKERRRWIVPMKQAKEVKDFYDKYYIKSLATLPPQVGPIPDLPELSEEVPVLRQPYEFQKKGIAFSLLNKKIINGDQPGLGKTTEAICTTQLSKATPTLIICPSTLKYNWEKELMDVAGEKALILNDRIANTWHRYVQLNLVRYVIVNFESLKKYFVSHINVAPGEPFKLKDVVFKEHIDLFKQVIVDEAHRLKDVKTQYTKFTAGICRGKHHIQLLTGTPVVNKTRDLISLIHILGRMQEFGGDKYFKARYCDTDEYLEELSYKLRTTCFFQRKKSEVLKDLPDKVRKTMLCDITTRKEYAQAERDLANYLRSYRSKTEGEIRRSMAGEAMVRFQLLKEISARGRLNDVFEWTDDLLAAGEKVILFIHQKVIRQKIHEKYPHAVTVTGDDTEDERREAIYRFQNDPSCNIIICSIKSAGVGITLTASSNVGMVEWPWHAADAEQCEDRAHRIGQKDGVQISYFLGINTVDQTMYQIIESKRNLAGTITGNQDMTMMEMVDKLSESLFNKDTVAA